MFIELVDALRCPVPHEESWLVASADRMEARHVVRGTLGCPVCRAAYPIDDGVVDFRAPGTRAVSDAGARSAVRALPDDDERALRLATLLDLSDAAGFAVLLGEWGAAAPALRSHVETPLLLIDPPEGVVGEPGISVLRTGGILPIAAGAARGVAIDAASAARADAAAALARTKGRVVAPVSVAVPPNVRELARDDELWVGERQPAASPVIALHVRRRS